jgi:hypothetical protein
MTEDRSSPFKLRALQVQAGPAGAQRVAWLRLSLDNWIARIA